MKEALLSIVCSLVWMQAFSVGFDQKKLALRSWDTTDGLVSNEATCFLQDNMGFIWIGTTNGLSRYDGYKFRTYKSNYQSPDFFTGNSVRCMAKDSRDRLFVGTTSGLNILDLKTEQVVQYSIEAMDCGIISAIVVDKKDVVYIGTAVGILRFNETEGLFENLKTDSNGTELKGNYIQSLFIDSRNVLWIGMWHTGFCALDLNDRLFYTYPAIVDGRQLSITSFYEDKDHAIWLSSWNSEGVYRLKNPLQKETFELNRYPVLYKNKSVNSYPSLYGVMQDDRWGYVWIATSDGLRILTDLDDPDSMIEYDEFEIEGIVSEEISAIYKDRTGVVWFSMYGAGICSVNLNEKLFSEYSFPEMRKNNEIKTITSVYEDERGTLWMGVKAFNLILFDPVRKRVCRHFQHPVLKALNAQSNAVMDIVRHSSREELWLATRYHGLYVVKLNKGEPQSLVHLDEQALKSPNVNQLVEGLNGYVWVATAEGLDYVENGSSGKYVCQTDSLVDRQIGKDVVNALWFDKKQTLWAGTQDNGLFRISLRHDGTPKYVRKYDQAGGKINNDGVVCFYSDSRGFFWVGTNGGGLSRYNPATDCFEPIENMASLPDDAILSIQEDDDGALWLSTGKGLVRYQMDLPPERRVKVFSSGDGRQINSFFPRASCKGKNGALFFGGANGLLWFSSDGFQENAYSPTPVITDIIIDNKSIADRSGNRDDSQSSPPFAKEIKLSYKNNSIRMEFSSLSFENPNTKTYAYKLAGIDEDWVHVKAADKYAVYNKLKKGTYRFFVKAFNEDGYTNGQVAVLRILREPAPWKTGWAYLMYAALGIALIVFVFRLLLNREKFKRALELEHMERIKSNEVNQTKLQFFTNVSHELFTPITVLSCSLDDLAAQRSTDASLAYVMRSNLNRLMRLLQQILEFRKAESGNLKLRVSQGNIAAFIHGIGEESFVPMMKTKEIDFRFRSDPEAIFGYFDSDKLDKIIFNLLSNAYKYNVQGGKIEVSLKKEKRESGHFVVIKVKDTGQGIDPQRMQNLFQRFYEGDYRKVGVKGTGIGLSLTKDLVVLHRGEIDVSSQVGVGTSFTVTLPIDASAYSEDQIDSSEETVPDVIASTGKYAETEADDLNAISKDITVLIVEDNEDLLRVLKNIMSRNFETLTALNGKEALVLLEENDVDVVVTDFVMPEMDGIELIRFIKKEVGYSHIPIVLLTAKQHTADKIKGFEAGADAYIAKPFEMNALIANIRSLVKNRRSISVRFSGEDRIKLSQFTYNSVDEDFLERAIRIVEENVRQSDFSAVDFHQAMNLSQATLYRKIKSIANLSPSGFIRNIKFKLACKLLIERKLTVTEAAYELGYIDPRYFSAVFKKEIGVSPSEYVRMRKNE